MTIRHSGSFQVRREGDVLVLEPASLHFLVIAALSLFAVFLCSSLPVFLVWTAGWLFEAGEWLWGGLVGLVAAALAFFFGSCLLRGVCSAGLWFQFDRAAGQIRRLQRPLGFWRKPRPVESWNVADCLRIQLRHGGTQAIEHSNYETQDGPVTYWTTTHHFYEFNLIHRKDDVEDNDTLITSYDWQWMRELGPQIGEFTGLAVSDELAHEDEVAG